MTIYCPRCGSPNTETTKFCRQCGLAVNQVTNYVASGGTAPLNSAPTPSILSGLTPQQQLVLTILFFVFLPGILGVLGGAIGLRQLPGIAGILMPLGIIWAVFRYKNETRRAQYEAWQQQQLRQQAQHQMPPHQPPAQMPSQAMPPQPYHQPDSPPTTNQLTHPPRGSITEDETQRFSGQN